MQFLKTALWVVLAVAIALFCKANWVSVPVKLWGDLIADVKLPVLMLGAFLLGAVPYWIVARATRWRLRKKLESTERALASATATPPLPSTPPLAPLPPPEEAMIVTTPS